MTIGKAGGTPHFQTLLDQSNFAKTRTVSADQGRVAAQNSGTASEKSKQERTGGERFTLSETLQAQLAREGKALSDDLGEARDALAQRPENQKTREKERKPDEVRVETRKPERTFLLDDGTEESYKVSESQAEALSVLDQKTPEQILEGMPEYAKLAAKATLSSQLETKGMGKVAKLKDDPKVSETVEKMKLGLADKEWSRTALAPIHSTGDQPITLDDHHSESLAKELAVRRMQAGGEELLVS